MDKELVDIIIRDLFGRSLQDQKDIILAALEKVREAAYASGYTEGRVTGYDLGFKAGLSRGYQEGFDKGYSSGYDSAYYELQPFPNDYEFRDDA